MNALRERIHEFLGWARRPSSYRPVGQLRGPDTLRLTKADERDDALVLSLGEQVERDDSVVADGE